MSMNKGHVQTEHQVQNGQTGLPEDVGQQQGRTEHDHICTDSKHTQGVKTEAGNNIVVPASMLTMCRCGAAMERPLMTSCGSLPPAAMIAISMGTVSKGACLQSYLCFLCFLSHIVHVNWSQMCTTLHRQSQQQSGVYHRHLKC